MKTNGLVLGIESSCDESAVALYGPQGLVAHQVYTQLAHAAYGGVVPELASRDHLARLPTLLLRTCERARVQISEIKAIAYTAGPGLVGALMVGTMIAKTLAWRLNIPSLAIHHMEAHLLSPLMEKPIRFPFLALLVSGGHTMLVVVRGWGSYQVIGESVDDAVGEAFDKVAKLLDLGYPGGSALAKLATQGNANAFAFPQPRVKDQPLNFSFSGLKTHVLQQITRLKLAGQWNESVRADIAASFEHACVETLTRQLTLGLHHLRQRGEHCQSVIVSGGVSANQRLRSRLASLAGQLGVDVLTPALELCGDNAAMVAFTGWLRLNSSEHPIPARHLSEVPQPRWDMMTLTPFSPNNFMASSC